MSVLKAGKEAHDDPHGGRLPARPGRGLAAPFRRPSLDELRAALARETAAEQAARGGFFLLPLGLIAGIATFYGLDLRLPPAAAAAGFLVLTGLTAVLRERILSRAVLTVLACALAGQMLAQAELARTHTTIFSGEATMRIAGRVAWRDFDDRGRIRYLIDIEETARPVLSRPPERARILVSSAHDPIPVGGTYKGLVRLRPPSGPALPGAHDFAFAPYFQGLGAYGFSLGAPQPHAAPVLRELGWAEQVASLRVSMAERIRAVVPGPQGAVAAALITGERAGIPAEIEEWLRITGLAHILAISGLHMALVAGFTMLSVRLLASLVPGLPLRLPTKKIAAVAALIVATAYLLIAGESVSTQRSWIMLVVMLGAVLLDRPALTLRNVAIAAVIVVTIKPHAVVTASFQMSFAATAALVGAYGALMRWWTARDRGTRRRERGLVLGVLAALAGLALSSLIAGGATAPFGAYHFQRAAPLGGVVANVLVMPLFSFVVMPAGLLGVLAMPFGLDGPWLTTMGHGLGIIFALAEAIGSRFPDHATGLMPRAALVLFSGAILALCFFAGRLRWLALPFAAAGIALSVPEPVRPELLIFEDGKEVALIDETGALRPMKARPNAFVATQWERAFPRRATANDAPGGETAPPTPAFVCQDDICRAETRSGLRVAWTEDYEKTGTLCDTSDIAIVSRAIRPTECRSGARLVTLRTLRRTGSLAVSRDPESGEVLIRRSIAAEPREWNMHRHAAWPEFWRDPARSATTPDDGLEASGADSSGGEPTLAASRPTPETPAAPGDQ